MNLLSFEECVALSSCTHQPLPKHVLVIVRRIESELKELEVQKYTTQPSRGKEHPISKRNNTSSWRTAGGPSTNTQSSSTKNNSKRMATATATATATSTTWRIPPRPSPPTTLPKQINLILNSIVETNADSIADRIHHLLAKYTAEDLNDVYDKMSTQLIVNAFAQSIYSEAYVSILKSSGSIFCQMLLRKCDDSLQKIISGQTTLIHESKGCGTFYAHLFIARLLTESQFATFLLTILDTLKDKHIALLTRDMCCQIFITTLQTIHTCLFKTNELPSFILKILQQDVVTLFSAGQDVIPMRIRIKLLDVKDLM
jgi:adenylate kinase